MSELSSEAPRAVAGVPIAALLEQAHISLAAVEAAFLQRGSRARGVPRELAELARIIARLGKTGHRLGREAARMRHAAYHDWLTGLPNRNLLVDRLDRAIAQAARNGNHVAVLMLDLNGFKRVNDQFGHVAGDRLLRDVAARLGASTRDADTVCRYGGDEFVILLPEVAGRSGASQVANKIDAELARAWDAGGSAVVISACLGVAVYPMDGATAADLLASADAAMYAAKDRLRSNASQRGSKGDRPREGGRAAAVGTAASPWVAIEVARPLAGGSS